jgi:succinate dehydrogenase / fumarate reductase cytochrome b subunit
MKSTIARKVLMALSGFFLLLFLFQHFVINSLSLGDGTYFNAASHFMGNNGIVQFIIQPILIVAVVFHLIMGIYLDMQNRGARDVKYQMTSPGKNSTWMSRNMVITGIMVLLFLGLHFYDFWIPEMNYKYIEGTTPNATRYYGELVEKFKDPVRTAIYILSFIFLSLHLMHGFQSAFQSVGFRHNRYTPMIKKLGDAYAILIPLGFVIIAVAHYVSHL